MKHVLQYVPHPHLYKLIEDRDDYNWGGVICRRRVWKCRFCKAQKARMSGAMPL